VQETFIWFNVILSLHTNKSLKRFYVVTMIFYYEINFTFSGQQCWADYSKECNKNCITKLWSLY